MATIASFLKDQFQRRNLRYVVVGVLMTILAFNLDAGSGTVITDQAEAEGPEFNNPQTVDLYSHVEMRRVCPRTSQRYAWRWEVYKGKRVQHAYPLFNTSVPFLPDGPDVVLSGPAVELPDPVTGGWLVRTNSVENCPWLPHFISKWFSSSVKKGPDVPTNFIGGPEQKAAP